MEGSVEVVLVKGPTKQEQESHLPVVLADVIANRRPHCVVEPRILGEGGTGRTQLDQLRGVG